MVLELLGVFSQWINQNRAYHTPNPTDSDKENIIPTENHSLDYFAYKKIMSGFNEELENGIRSTESRLVDRKTRLLNSKEKKRQSDLAVLSSGLELEESRVKSSRIHNNLESLLGEMKVLSEQLQEERKYQKESETELIKIDHVVADSKVLIEEFASSLKSISNEAEAIKSDQLTMSKNHLIAQENLISSRERISNLQQSNRQSKVQISNYDQAIHSKDHYDSLVRAIREASYFSLVALNNAFNTCNSENICYIASKIQITTLDAFYYIACFFSDCTREAGAWAWNFIIGSIPRPAWVAITAIIVYKSTKIIPARYVFIVISAISIYEYFLKNFNIKHLKPSNPEHNNGKSDYSGMLFNYLSY